MNDILVRAKVITLNLWNSLRKIQDYYYFSKSLKSSLTSVQFSRSVMSDSLRHHGLQHARLPCPSPAPGAYSNSCPSSLWCHSTISSSVITFSSCLQPFPASGSFPMSQFFTSGGWSIGVSTSASVLPMNIQDWFWKKVTWQNSLELNSPPCRSSPPFYAKQRTPSPEQKNGH